MKNMSLSAIFPCTLCPACTPPPPHIPLLSTPELPYVPQSQWWASYFHKVTELLFRITRAGIFPRSSQKALGSWGFGNLEGGGQLGEGWDKWGQFTSNLRPRWTIPVTARRVPSKQKGIQGGDKGEPARGDKKPGELRHVYM